MLSVKSSLNDQTSAEGGGVLNGKTGNIDDIVNKYADMIYRVAFAYLGTKAEAEDAVSEVMLRYLAQCRRNEGGKEFTGEQHIKAWLLRVTINLCKDMLKSFRVKKTLPLEASTNAVLALHSEEMLETKLDIEAALDSLSPDYRIVIFLYYYQGYSTKEIARLLDIPKNTVVSRMSRGRKTLRQRLMGYWDVDSADNTDTADTADNDKKGVTETHA